MAQTQYARYPFAAADSQSVADAATIAVTITNSVTWLAIDQLAQDSTLNLTITDGIPVGSLLYVKAQSDATARALVPGTGMTGTSVSGTINKTKIASYFYDGTTFKHIGTQQID